MAFLKADAGGSEESRNRGKRSRRDLFLAKKVLLLNSLFLRRFEFNCMALGRNAD